MSNPKVLIIDDDQEIHEILRTVLAEENCEVSSFTSPNTLLESLASDSSDQVPDLIVSDIKMPEMDGLELIRKMRERIADTPVIFITGHGSLETAIEAIREGAFDYLTKPIRIPDMRVAIQRALRFASISRENRVLRREVQKSWKTHGSIIGKSEPIRRVFDLIARVAPTDANVLITGESGTGKELVAQAIHDQGPRAKGPFIAINCSAIPENLLESELFGHSKGAFTGAAANKKGLFEEAEGGTIFLDEIGDMPTQLQTKLLRVLQEKKVKPVGKNQFVDINIRVLAATHKNLREAIRNKEFREDLYYRLNILPIELPPLRRRAGDIPVLADHFLRRFAASYGRKLEGFTEAAMKKILEHPWPGNVRELENTIERGVILCDQNKITAEAIVLEETDPERDQLSQINFPDDLPLKEIENNYIKHILNRYDGVKEKAAEVLGIDRKTLYRKHRVLS